ncbi:hypothetical protein ACOMCU_01495 [Lysinibacillus sp. UGB7]|uniref:hypothetical protein n=1 Tax=Lysinibacillus sp. UGB7 TaxID=3411039 RepID=UPI003B7784B1
MTHVLDFSVFTEVSIPEKLEELQSFLRLETVSHANQTCRFSLSEDGTGFSLGYGETEIADTILGIDLFVNFEHIGYMEDAEEDVVAYHCLLNYMKAGWDRDVFIENAHTYFYGYHFDFQTSKEEAQTIVFNVWEIVNRWNNRASSDYEKYISEIGEAVFKYTYNTENETNELTAKEKLSTIYLYLHGEVKNDSVEDAMLVLSRLQEVVYK